MYLQVIIFCIGTVPLLSPARGPATPLAFIALLLSVGDSAVPEQEVQSVGWVEMGVPGPGPGCSDSDVATSASLHVTCVFVPVERTSDLTSSVVAFLQLYCRLVVLELNDLNTFA